MIYLIDDKKTRQVDCGWNELRFDEYKDTVYPIYSYEEMSGEEFRKDMFSKNNILLIHESFFNKSDSKSKDFVSIRENIYRYAKENSEALIVFFSGSIVSRKVDGNVAYMPVSVFYQNLKTFVNHTKHRDVQLDYLFFGENPEIENELIEIRQKANNKIDEFVAFDTVQSSLYIRPSQNFIQKPLENYDDKIIYNKVEDKDFIEKINDWLSAKKYDNIFIPLCFGPTLSDYNGLRLATLIRCTKTINQLSNIFIYSFLGMEYLYNHSCFNILKTKNVQLIDYKKAAFKEAVEKKLPPYHIEELPDEITKLKLDVPDNYEDNHSIANEWGVYQLAYNADIDINEVSDFNKEKLDSLYFKWLIAKNGLYEDLPQEEKEENKEYRKKKKGVKVIGKIDLSKIPKR